MTPGDAPLADAPLADLGRDADAEIVAIDVEDDARPWLEAVGLSVGERVTVLRHALFGGPLHVRTRSGGEFALARSLARRIRVRRAEGAS